MYIFVYMFNYFYKNKKTKVGSVIIILFTKWGVLLSLLIPDISQAFRQIIIYPYVNANRNQNEWVRCRYGFFERVFVWFGKRLVFCSHVFIYKWFVVCQERLLKHFHTLGLLTW